MEARSGKVLYMKNGHLRRPPASTTKMMTGILAIEQGDLKEWVTISQKAARVGEASIHLTAGEKLRLEDLVKGALIRSGNDAAAAVAEHVGGSEEFFIYLMNKKARLLGAGNTLFQNPHGLPAQNHYASAYDLGLIARYALTNEVFASIVRTRETTIRGSWSRYLRNTNRLLWRYPWANGVKTGTTDAAGKCLVASATREGLTLIAVVLKSHDRYRDAETLLEYGFQNFDYYAIAKGSVWGTVKVANGKPSRVTAVALWNDVFILEKDRKKDLRFKVNIVSEVQAPLRKGENLGFLEVFKEEQRIGRIPLGAGEESRKLGLIERLRKLGEGLNDD
ncbi:serine-type D-Ala-D-Ala carboxypeptidase [Calderihabitans maritimus]|uniref:serine-type D-Ala-D-Ala carboxypeptidase n=2 Tax=Calderihabitans maritimus TaxID=1246530 RepID=A0A1Z5HQS8_9FIRM|nr:serine-type D-Ala-D-Ala carboxypeptidase [Calderihabitans maritimus]